MENVIIVSVVDFNKAILTYDNLIANAFIGINGSTINKVEGDKRTPLGMFDIGIVFGTHCKKDIKLDESLEYIKITNSMYWVCDANSKYYNQLIDLSTNNKNWNSAEHLIEYKNEYEYAIELKTNPNNIPNKGSAIFLHCGNKNTSRLYCNWKKCDY